MGFKENLKAYRERAGLSRQDVAEKIHITANGYGLYETGRTEPKLDTLVKLAEVLGITTDMLLGKSADIDDFEKLKARIELYGFKVREESGKVLVDFHSPDTLQASLLPAVFDSEKEFCDYIGSQIQRASGRAEKQIEWAVYDFLNDWATIFR